MYLVALSNPKAGIFLPESDLEFTSLTAKTDLIIEQSYIISFGVKLSYQ